MNLFLRLIRLSVQQQLTYRTALLSGLATNLFFALLRAALFAALYAGREAVNGLTLPAAITYMALSQGLIAYLSMFGTWEVMNSVYTGSIGADMLRPVPLFFLWMGRDFGRSLVNLVLRGILLLACFALFYPLVMPRTVSQWLVLPLALLLSWLMSYAFRFLVNLAAFWTPDARGIGRMAFMAMSLFSGFLIPLRLLPDWFASICHLTPFPSLVNTAVEVYLGTLQGPAMWRAIASQAVWFLGVALLSNIVLRAGLRKLVVQGG